VNSACRKLLSNRDRGRFAIVGLDDKTGDAQSRIQARMDILQTD